MTLTNENAQVIYFGNGSTTEFPFDFLIPEGGMLVRLFDGTTTSDVPSGQYSVSGLGDLEGGTVTMFTPPAEGQELYIIRDLPFVQQTEISNQTRFFATVVEQTFDYMTMLSQQLRAKVNHAVLARPGQDPETLADNLFAAEVAAGEASTSAQSAATAAASAATAAEQSLAAIDAKITVSDQPPSGGSEGDIWLQYET